MSILPVGIGPQEGGYQIERSLRFNSADSAYLSRTPASAGNRKTWTFSFWFKRGLISDNVIFGSRNASVTTAGYIGFQSDKFDFQLGSTGNRIQDAAVRRDPSAWAHYVVVCDTPNATSTDRMQLWVNGVRVTTFTTASYPSQNADSDFNVADFHAIGRYGAASSQYVDGYLTEVNFIDGQALDPTSFGEYNSETGVWQPKAYTGSYGTNGFYLKFADNSNTTAATLGKDSSGNGNNWTPNNFSVTAGAGNDSLVDTPTPYGTDTGAGGEVRGNYATLNPLDKGSAVSLANGNLVMSSSNASYSWLARSTMALPSSGKWYWEVELVGGTIVGHAAGIYSNNFPTQTSGWISSTGNSYQVGFGYIYSYIQYQSGSASFANWGTNTNPVIGDKLMFAYDADNQALWVGRNGTWYNTSGTANPATNTDPRWTSVPAGLFPGFNAANPTGEAASFNFGQRPFAYTAPSGFKALCTQNLPEPTIADGGDYFNAVLYAGTGASASFTGVGFQPDFTWIKSRSAAQTHGLFDSNRGVQKLLQSNSTAAELTSSGYLTSFDSDGFSIGSGTQFLNGSGDTYVAWNWKAGGTGVSNTDGSITSTVSANTTAGFSIVSWTANGSANQSIGHGLGAVPSMIITKDRDNGTYNWAVWFKGFSANEYILLNTTGAKDSYSTLWYQTPTSSVFYVGSTGTGINSGTDKNIAYCFAPVEGYSAFGSYTGNGSSDGVFVYTGFTPRWLMWKRTDASGTGWVMYDTAREESNLVNLELEAQSSAAEFDTTSVSPGYPCDILSNGFKLRGSRDTGNASGGTYIYAAFAENPFKYALAR